MAGSGKPIVQGSCKALQRAYKASQRGSTIASRPGEAMVEPTCHLSLFDSSD